MVSEEEIARCAYELWRQEGCPDGRATEHWLQAEKKLRAASAGQSESARPPMASKARRGSGSKAAGSKREKRFEMVS